jgi:hypothetical protein
MNKKINMLVKILFFQALFLPVLSLNAQLNSGGNDATDILLNERVVDRPVSLHKSQLQTNAFYAYDFYTKSYDNSSARSNLRDQGIASARHGYLFNISYGILEHIQLTVGMNYTSSTQRSTVRYIYISENGIRESEITETKGFEDLYIGSILRLPLNLRIFDMGISLGITLPTAKYRTEHPEHQIESIAGFTNSFIFNYHNINPPGKGVPAYMIGIQGKFRTRKMAVNLRSDYRMSNMEATNTFWQYRIENNEYDYQSHEYNYMIDDLFRLAVHVDYQAFAWFDILGGFSSENTFGGWSEQYGPRISNYETSLNSVFIGFEIQATPHIRLYQRAGQTVSGKNTIAPVSFITGISYNLFPSKEF